MRRIALSFHKAIPWREHWFGFLCLGVGVAAAVITTWFGWQTYAEHLRWTDYVVTLKQDEPAHQVDVRSNDTDSIKTELQAASAVIDQLDMPWAGLFSVLETTYSDNAILLGVEPEPSARSIQLTAEAKDMSNMLAFVRLLRQSRVLADAYVTSHAINQQDAQRPIRFVVSSHWLDVAAPDTPADVPASTPAVVNAPDKGAT